MSLRVFTGKRNFFKPDEAKFFYQFAHVLKKIFKDEEYDGILLGVPILKGFSNRYLPIDAVLFTKNAIIIVDFKSHGGVITTPTNDKNYRYDGWTADDGQEIVPVHGGKLYPNPFVQVQTYKQKLSKEVLFNISGATGKFINTGVIFYGNNLDLSKVYIPGAMKSNFFVASGDLESKDSYLYAIKSILNCEKRERTVDLTDAELTGIREKFDVHEELTDEEIDKLTGISAAELAEKDSQIQSMKAKIDAKNSLLAEKRRELRQKDRELSRKDSELADQTKTTHLLAEKNLELIKKNEQSEKDRKRLQQTIDDLREQKDWSPKMAKKLDQMYYDVKALKIRDYGQEISDKWEQRFGDLQRELSDIKKSAASTNNIYLISNNKPKWLTALIATITSLLVIAITSVIVGAAIFQKPQENGVSIQITKPDALEGPYNAYVYDGDTINIYDGGKARLVRLIGIDAPEVESDYRKAECFNKQAKTYISDKIYGNQVYLEYDDSQGNVDIYGRLLRYVWVGDEMLNLSLLADGYAEEFTYNNAYKYKNEFNAAQAKAKNNGTGLWTTCAK